MLEATLSPLSSESINEQQGLRHVSDTMCIFLVREKSITDITFGTSMNSIQPARTCLSPFVKKTFTWVADVKSASGR